MIGDLESLLTRDSVARGLVRFAENAGDTSIVLHNADERTVT
jgi:hypothetical protein